MRTLLTTIGFLALGGITGAQQTRVELPKPTTPADDAKGLSDAVPAGYALEGKFERILVFRFKFDTDLLAGIEALVKQHKIKHAVILSGIGAVRGYHIHTVSNRTFPSKNIFVKDPTAPADITSVNGYVIDGRVHAHITLANPDKAFGGHLEPGTTVFAFAIITVGVFAEGIDLGRVDDKTYR